MTYPARLNLPASPDNPITVKALIWQGDACLILRKSVSRQWDLPGGRLEPGESWWDGLTREVREELGAEVAQAAFLCDAIKPRATRADLYIGFFTCVLAPVAERRFVLSAEHDASAWITAGAVSDRNMPEPYRQAISRAGLTP